MATRSPVADAVASDERSYTTDSAAVRHSLEKLWKRYGRYAAPADQVRAELDQQLAEQTLSAVLHEVRDK